MNVTRLRIRSPREPIGVILASFSFVLGVGGLILGAEARSNAIENAFPDLLATLWYVALAGGSACMLLAAAQKWPHELDLKNAYCTINRLYLERAGLFIVGWVWQSYAFAAIGVQSLAGSTAACISTVIGLWTGFRIREQFVDLPPLRAWIVAEETRLDAEGT